MNQSAVRIAAPTLDAQASLGEGLKHVSILCIDQERGMREFLTRALQAHCKKIRVVGTAEAASEALDEQHFDLVLLENVLPDMSGLDWLRQQRRIGLCSEAIVITAYADLDTVVCAMRAGASDFLLKPLRAQQLLSALLACVERRYNRRRHVLPQFRTTVDLRAKHRRLLGKSPRIEEVRQTLERVAKTSTPVLITGESGSGKEIAARLLHAMSDRANSPFVVVNCAALSPERFSSDMLGQFDESALARSGPMAVAVESTVFLDEIVEMPMATQAALLRVIDEGRVRPGAQNRELRLNLRFVCSTNTNLDKAIEAGRFRRDLYHRINVVTVEMPALRDRVGDIPELTAMFMDEIAREIGAPPLPVSERLLCSLARNDWPGNVRELRNLVEQAVVLGEFPAELDGSAESAPDLPVESLRAVERQHILSVLEACGGNRAEAARRLGISRKTIDRKCAMWNL